MGFFAIVLVLLRIGLGITIIFGLAVVFGLVVVFALAVVLEADTARAISPMEKKQKTAIATINPDILLTIKPPVAITQMLLLSNLWIV